MQQEEIQLHLSSLQGHVLHTTMLQSMYFPHESPVHLHSPCFTRPDPHSLHCDVINCNSNNTQSLQKHDEKCTNEFYNAHVMDYLKLEKATKKESNDMAKKLKLFYDQQMEADAALDDEIYRQKMNEQLLGENMDKLQRLALNDEIDINDLTQFQQQQFAKSLQNGQLHHHIDVWTPWWSRTNRKVILSETDVLSGVDVDDKKEENLTPNVHQQNQLNISLIVPPVPVDIPSFTSIHAKEPSPLLPFLCSDILCGYVGAMIKYNGDWNDEPSHVLQLILSISVVLSDPKCVYQDFKEMTNGLMGHYASQSVKHNKFEILLYLKQVAVLMRSRMNVLRALNQMYELVVVIQNQIMNTSKVSKSLRKQIRKRKQIKDRNHRMECNQNKSNNEIKENNETKESPTGHYFDDHADAFMKLMGQKEQNLVISKDSAMNEVQRHNGNECTEQTANLKNDNQSEDEHSTNDRKERTKCYSSSFAPEKMRKITRRKCKRLDPLKRKIWYYLVWWNDHVEEQQSNLLAAELSVVVESIDRKLNQMDEQIKSTMFK